MPKCYLFLGYPNEGISTKADLSHLAKYSMESVKYFMANLTKSLRA